MIQIKQKPISAAIFSLSIKICALDRFNQSVIFLLPNIHKEQSSLVYLRTDDIYNSFTWKRALFRFLVQFLAFNPDTCAIRLVFSDHCLKVSWNLMGHTRDMHDRWQRLSKQKVLGGIPLIWFLLLGQKCPVNAYFLKARNLSNI